MKKLFMLTWLSCILFASTAQEVKPHIKIYLNKDVSTHLITSESITYVDISTPNVIGDLPIDNICRLKPLDSIVNGEIGIVSIVTERNIYQCELIYVDNKNKSTTQYRFNNFDKENYLNPEITIPAKEMRDLAWQIYTQKRSYYDVSQSLNKMRVTLNNIVTVDNLFFVDISIDNFSKIQYDIDQIRFKIVDKKKLKATSFQDLEVKPILNLLDVKTFKKSYRNVFVLEKFTFPEEKAFIIEISEKVISGRTITLKIDYADVLNADSVIKSVLF